MPIARGHEDYMELASSYAIDALEDEDRLRFEKHLASGCAVCEEALLDAERVAGDLALLAPRIDPPDSVRRGLFEKVRGNEKKSSPAGGSNVMMFLAAAAALAAVGLGLYNRSLQERIDTEVLAREALERELATLGETLDAFAA
ncbi:MAG: hypothetical protein ACRD21_29675, partial [Vicinamibacteria bacterium]